MRVCVYELLSPFIYHILTISAYPMKRDDYRPVYGLLDSSESE